MDKRELEKTKYLVAYNIFHRGIVDLHGQLQTRRGYHHVNTNSDSNSAAICGIYMLASVKIAQLDEEIVRYAIDKVHQGDYSRCDLNKQLSKLTVIYKEYLEKPLKPYDTERKTKQAAKRIIYNVTSKISRIFGCQASFFKPQTHENKNAFRKSFLRIGNKINFRMG